MAKKADTPNDYRQIEGGLNHPFALLNPGGTASAPASPPSAPLPRQRPRVPRAVVRMERAGRGGKEVTVVDHLDLQPTEFERWLKQLKSGLGCGGVVEGRTLVLQGDQRKRLPKLLESLGVGKVIVG